ncbi:AAA family ATPase [Bacillus sp. ISL-41]|uniref:AAA family ATPase n=1 Tax=Bacillus sp. ISL-41 TaxID=2819127 RepID=UPI001BE898DB|nr:AAA family ATPase [Bacillus sp. ISL-41]MBT2643433.1 AAA family ATPase [Bacillus sp. ISL-41]
MKNGNHERAFPEELLEKTKEERVEFFKNYTVAHPKMGLVLKELKKEIYTGDCNVILIVGPSGVGKSRLFERTLHSVYLDMAEQMEADKSIIPITGIELPNPDLGKFNWKDFYYRVLTGLNEPLIDHKVDYQKFFNQVPKDRISTRKSETAPELRRSLENALYYRKTNALLIDEAQHFFKIENGRSVDIGTGVAITRQFNSLKSLANMANTKIVLFGTYALNAVINLDGQLSRRVKEVHFPRYDYRNKQDKKMFRSVLVTFQKLLPVHEEPNLTEHEEFIYENCVGCAGILKDWLQRCLSYAIENDEKTISIYNLKKNALQTQKLLTLAEEALIGESIFIEKEEDRVQLKSLLGTEKKEERAEKTTKQKRNPLPGNRSPERDVVGQ